MPFTVEVITTAAKAQAQVGYLHNKLLVNIYSENSGRPVSVDLQKL